MLIHRVNVVGVVQNHTEQPAKLGDERPKNPAAVHFQEGLVNALLPLEDLKKREVRRCRATKSIIDESRMFAQKLPRFLTWLAAVLLHIGEHFNEIARLRLQDIRLGDGELSLYNANTLAHGPGEAVTAVKNRPRAFCDAVND